MLRNATWRAFRARPAVLHGSRCHAQGRLGALLVLQAGRSVRLPAAAGRLRGPEAGKRKVSLSGCEVYI